MTHRDGDGDCFAAKDNFGVNVGHPIVTNWYFTAKLCKTMSVDQDVI